MGRSYETVASIMKAIMGGTMPSGPWLSAESLGIEPWERTGLIRMREQLVNHEYDKGGDKCFDMGTTMVDDHGGCDEHVCGCIGGHVGLNHFDGSISKAAGYVDKHGPWGSDKEAPLSGLYYPRTHDGRSMLNNLHRVTTEQAAEAIENFLTVGAPGWMDILPSDIKHDDEDDDDEEAW